MSLSAFAHAYKNFRERCCVIICEVCLILVSDLGWEWRESSCFYLIIKACIPFILKEILRKEKREGDREEKEKGGRERE